LYQLLFEITGKETAYPYRIGNDFFFMWIRKIKHSLIYCLFLWWKERKKVGITVILV